MSNANKFGFKFDEAGKRVAMAAVNSARWPGQVVANTLGVSLVTINNLRYENRGMYKAAFAEMKVDKDAFIAKYLTSELISKLNGAVEAHYRKLGEQELERARQRLEERARARAVA